MTTQSMIASPIGAMPYTGECPYCHKPLKKTSVMIGSRVFDGLPCYGSCGCERSMMDLKPKPEKPPSRAELYARAGIGSEYRQAKARCEEHVRAVLEGRNVFIVGANGNGKSMLAAAIAMRLIDLGKGVLFVNAAIEAQAIKNGFGTVTPDRRGSMCKAPVLVLDDLGKGNPSEWDSSLWYTVAEARNADGLPTITTTNYDGGELVARLTANGDDSTARAIVSRLRGSALTVKMRGHDMRLGKREEACQKPAKAQDDLRLDV